MDKLINSALAALVASWAWVTLSVLLIFNAPSATGVRLKNVTIPRYAEIGPGPAPSVQLFCDFSLESDQLLVLKWYKDDQEFFRYSPSSDPPIVIFNTSGVHVDVWRSSLNKVTLRNLSLDSAGVYKCEVSADKTFQTLTKEGQMDVIAPPLFEPEIFGVPPSASVGELITGKCTSHRSKPAAELNFYVNNELANSYVTEYITITEPDGLDSSVLGFNFSVRASHFQVQLQPRNGDRNRINLKCTAIVGNSFLVRAQSVAASSTSSSAGATTRSTDSKSAFQARGRERGRNRFLTGAAAARNGLPLPFGFGVDSLAILMWARILSLFLY